MKKIGFIGAFEKTDLILYIAKILTRMDERVLVIDTTLEQRAKYIVPAITHTDMYITSYEDIDVAVGVHSFEDIAHCLGHESFNEDEYTYVLVDVDDVDYLKAFNLDAADKNYFVTSFDLYSLKKGIEILDKLKEPLELTKILFSRNMLKEEDDYLNYLSLGKKVNWDKEKIYFPYDRGDTSAIAENQRLERIRLTGVSNEYKDVLAYVVEEITGDNNVRRLLKQMEKETN